MGNFAKLFETEEHGQILVKKDEGDEGLEVRIYIQPENLGRCNFAYIYQGQNREEQSAKCFERIDSTKAMDMVVAFYEKFDLSAGGSDLPFAKLYENQDYGQILVLLEEDEEDSEVRFYFQPEGMGVYNCSLPFKKGHS